MADFKTVTMLVNVNIMSKRAESESVSELI
jgi:hypothetical protein